MTSCKEWVGTTNGRSGYGQRRDSGKKVLVHRWAMAQVYGWEALDGKVVAHRCDNPRCYNVDHLFVTTQAGNMADMKSKGHGRGGVLRGLDNGSVKLDETAVAEIRQDKRTNTELGRVYGVDRNTIRAVRRRETWNHVP